MTEKLTIKEKTEIAIQAGLQLVPYVGASLSALYFGTKQEKRFKRIESFYQEFSDTIEQRNLQLPSIDFHNQDNLISLIEQLNDKVEREQTEQKREYFKKYLFSTLSSPTNDNFDERRFFLEILANMTLLECDLLILLHQQSQPVKVGAIKSPGIDQYAIVGAIGRLKMHGLLSAFIGDFSVGGGDNALNEYVAPSSFGMKFINYCLE
ncbi:TPA: hypothetical protein ROX98_002248 [Bacillus pseudomycoides]|nr:hypothetical protein [Bacillus pseudomycoides]